MCEKDKLNGEKEDERGKEKDHSTKEMRIKFHTNIVVLLCLYYTTNNTHNLKVKQKQNKTKMNRLADK